MDGNAWSRGVGKKQTPPPHEQKCFVRGKTDSQKTTKERKVGQEQRKKGKGAGGRGKEKRREPAQGSQGGLTEGANGVTKSLEGVWTPDGGNACKDSP